ncbi:MAG: TIGR03088 family PEP-CTERM/XrtA system glycosyltransferase [Burkholderiaceae bacterium]|nr:TIGR03088 family PEP-CTERM/XrtA system glycosyltransferase [Burkholderiaceae bacterium]
MTRARGAGEVPLIVHVVHRFDVGGMENGVVNLINGLPEGFARHCVVALTEVASSFARRIGRGDVRFVELHKPPGQTVRVLPRLWRELRALRPAIVHTRNVATIEAQLAAVAAGVPARIHGEHGWDIGDLDGSNLRMLWLRRLLKPLVHRQVALSAATERYLIERVHVPRSRVSNICNGVDTARFAIAGDREAARRATLPPHWPEQAFVVGLVGRVAAVKNLQLALDAFARLRGQDSSFAQRARLAVVGDGPELPAVRARASALGLGSVVWFAGAREDVARCLQAIDLVCLPSLAEGISNAVLEAMACGVAVVATEVGGNPDLVVAGVTGELVPSADAGAMARAIATYFTDARRLRAHGAAARERAVTEFSLAAMLSGYHRIYAEQLRRIGFAAGTRSDPDALSPGR